MGIEVEERAREQHSEIVKSSPVTEESDTLDHVGPVGQDYQSKNQANMNSREHVVINAHERWRKYSEPLG